MLRAACVEVAELSHDARKRYKWVKSQTTQIDVLTSVFDSRFAVNLQMDTPNSALTATCEQLPAQVEKIVICRPLLFKSRRWSLQVAPPLQILLH